MDYIPKDLIQSNITLENKWKKLIKDAFHLNQYVTERAPRIAAKVRRIIWKSLKSSLTTVYGCCHI